MRAWTIGRKLFTVIGVLVGLFLLSVAIVGYQARGIERSAAQSAQAISRFTTLADLEQKGEHLLFVEKDAIAAAYSNDLDAFEARVREGRRRPRRGARPVAAGDGHARARRRHQRTAAVRRRRAALGSRVHRGRAAGRGRASRRRAGDVADQEPPGDGRQRGAPRRHCLAGAAGLDAAGAANAAAIGLLIATSLGTLAAALLVGALAAHIARDITRALAHVASGLSGAAHQVTDAATQVSASAQTLSQGLTEQAASL